MRLDENSWRTYWLAKNLKELDQNVQLSFA